MIDIKDVVKEEWVNKKALIIIKEIDSFGKQKKLIFNGLILDINNTFITFRDKYNNLKSFALIKIDEIQEIKDRGVEDYEQR